MFEIFKKLPSPKTRILLFDVDKCIRITKITEEEFPYKYFRYLMKFQKESESYGSVSMIQCDVPDKVKQGIYRKNLVYRLSDSRWGTGYIAREEGLFKLESYSTVDDMSKMVWNEIGKIDKHFQLFVTFMYKYRHKPLKDIRDITIMKFELEAL